MSKKRPYLPIFVYGRLMAGNEDFDFIDLKEKSIHNAELHEHSLYVAHSAPKINAQEFPVLVEDNNPRPMRGELIYLQEQYYDTLIQQFDERYHKAHLPDADFRFEQTRTKVVVHTETGKQVTAWTYRVNSISAISMLESEAFYLSDMSWEDYLLQKMDADLDQTFLEEWEDTAFDYAPSKLDDERYIPAYSTASSSTYSGSKSLSYNVKKETKSKFYMEPATKDSVYVWYVAYGSNLSSERFLKYMNVGRFTDKKKFTVDDLDSVQIEIPHRAFFAKSGRWGKGGIAFLDLDTIEDFTQVARAYRLTLQQFWSLVCQENGSKHMSIPWNDLMSKDRIDCKETGLYSTIAVLGSIEGEMAVTCTNRESFGQQCAGMKTQLPWQYEEMRMINPPSAEYLNVINTGMEETKQLEYVVLESRKALATTH